jgi:hypothetical protein
LTVTSQPRPIRLLRNLAVILKEAGKSMDDVVRVGVYLTDMADFAAMNEVYSRHFQAPYPARTAIEVSALPLGAAIEFRRGRELTMDAEFCLVDVFSDQPFGGNQLAVFPRAEGLSAPVMQQLAREFNFAETTFVVPSKDPGCAGRVRIFTPQTELPFAGHPTVGTAAVMASLDPSTRQFVFEEASARSPSPQRDLPGGSSCRRRGTRQLRRTLGRCGRPGPVAA